MIVLRWVLDLEHHLGVGVERLDLLVPEKKSDISLEFSLAFTITTITFSTRMCPLPEVLSSSKVHLVGARGEQFPGEEGAGPAILVGQPGRHLGPGLVHPSHPAHGDGDPGGRPAGSGVEDVAAHRVCVAPDGGPRHLSETRGHRGADLVHLLTGGLGLHEEEILESCQSCILRRMLLSFGRGKGLEERRHSMS